MNRSWIMRGLIAAVLLQLGILATEYVNSVYPLWTGQEVRLKTVPVDPRSLFRGNYARLNYDISNITLQEKEYPPAMRRGEIVYVKLKQDEDGVHVFDGASLSKPDMGLYIRGRIQTPRWTRTASPYRVHYGIEAFFAPKEKALALEKDLRRGAVAIVMVANNGKAALKDVIQKAKQELPDETEGLSEIEKQKHLELIPEERRVSEELRYLKYTQDALSRDDPESAYRLIEDGLISEYEEVRDIYRQFIEHNPILYEGARRSFRFESLKESIRMYGEDASELENRRLSIYKTVASVEDYSEARQSFVKVFGEID